jgi:hypothetical protein
MKDLNNEEGRDPEGDAAIQAGSKGLDQKSRDDHATERGRLEPLFTAGLELIPLHAPDALDRKGRAIGKAPLRSGWRKTSALDLDDAVEHLAGGRNVGVRLRANDLVIDADPRHYEEGDDPLARLLADFGLPTHPHVMTGGGGVHLYLTKPADVRTVETLDEYQGIEFKVQGRQVVAPGSIQPETGRTYLLELDPLDDNLTMEAPMELVLALTRPVSVGTSEVGNMQPERLSQVLDVLDAADYREQDKWLNLMMACHHATGGAGREEFVAWSIGDPQYSEDEWIVGRRWDSFNADDKGQRVTEGTLMKIVYDSGKAHLIPADSDAADDFEGEEFDVPEGALDARPPMIAPLPNTTPMTLAGVMLRKKPVVRSNGDWLRYDTGLNSYVEEEQETFSARVWTWADGHPYRKGEEEKRLVATTSLVANVTAAASAQRQGPRDLPAWHPRRVLDPDPADLLAVRNGLLNLANGELLPPNPRFINRNASPVAYDPSAACPQRWEKFLHEVFPDDQDVQDTLQEVIGYGRCFSTAARRLHSPYGSRVAILFQRVSTTFAQVWMQSLSSHGLQTNHCRAADEWER